MHSDLATVILLSLLRFSIVTWSKGGVAKAEYPAPMTRSERRKPCKIWHSYAHDALGIFFDCIAARLATS